MSTTENNRKTPRTAARPRSAPTGRSPDRSGTFGSTSAQPRKTAAPAADIRKNTQAARDRGWTHPTRRLMARKTRPVTRLETVPSKIWGECIDELRTTDIVSVWSSRRTRNSTVSPGRSSVCRCRRAGRSAIGVPSMDSTTSPTLMPARSAGDQAATASTRPEATWIGRTIGTSAEIAAWNAKPAHPRRKSVRTAVTASPAKSSSSNAAMPRTTSRRVVCVMTLPRPS